MDNTQLIINRDLNGKDHLLDNPELFINRELSWISFNYRVLEEAQDLQHPLLESVKFLAICGSNLDEFFMTRIPELQKQINAGSLKITTDGMTPFSQLEATRAEIIPLIEKHSKCWKEGLVPALKKQGIRLLKFDQLGESQRSALREYLKNEIVPVMKPPIQFFTHSSLTNLLIYLFVMTESQEGESSCLVEVPSDKFKRLVQIRGEVKEESLEFIFLEDLIASNLDLVFPGKRIAVVYPFRLTRNAEIDITINESADFLIVMEESVKARKLGSPSRLEVDVSMPEKLEDVMANNIGLPSYLIYRTEGPLGLVDLWQLQTLDRPELKDETVVGYVPPELGPDKDLFGAIRKKDYVLYHPYDSFEIVINLLRQAAKDPNVIAIYITLYRIDPKSPVIEALIEASKNGKSVTAMIELKAKFDEENNINWAKKLGKEGVKVVYNFQNIKVHAKLCQIVRREGDEMVEYSHIGSGNYNAVTTKLYGDIGYLTTNKQIGKEVYNLFHTLTGEPQKEEYSYLIVAPEKLKSDILYRIEREIESFKRTGEGYMAFKLNGLVDKDIIKALYRASQAGIKIDLNVRGLCCLRPGIRGVSDNIRVISIVGRFLEHARIYYFRNGGEDEVLLGSSDLMPRNLEKRVEVMFSVPDPKIKRAVLEDMLNIHLKDNIKARRLLPSGKYERILPDGEGKINSQLWLIDNRGIWHGSPIS